jgi:uncharacterized protein (TIGR02996 family)
VARYENGDPDDPTIWKISRDANLESIIRASPGDAEAKRIYADWLTENGDPRGELIALELSAASTSNPAARARCRQEIESWHTRHDPLVLGVVHEFRRVIDLRRDGFLREARISYNPYSAAGPPVEDLLDALLALPAACILSRLGLGGIGRDDPADGRYAAALAVLARHRCPIESLHLGDAFRDRGLPMTGLLVDLVSVYPALASLRELMIAMGEVRFGTPQLPEWRRLELRQGWTEAMLEEIAAATLPLLHTLAIDISGHDLSSMRSLFEARGLSALRELGVRGAGDTLAVVELPAASPLVAQLVEREDAATKGSRELPPTRRRSAQANPGGRWAVARRPPPAAAVAIRDRGRQPLRDRRR